MADTLTTKKVTELTENTAMSDEDLFMVGSAGTASLRKLKWSNIWNTIKTAILGKLAANNLTTTAAGYLLDARQGKALDDKISKLNTDLTGKVIIENITVTIGANTDYSYVPYKTGYVLVAVHGTTFAGIYATGFADTGSNYSVFYNVASGQTASITLSLMWVKI